MASAYLCTKIIRAGQASLGIIRFIYSQDLRNSIGPNSEPSVFRYIEPYVHIGIDLYVQLVILLLIAWTSQWACIYICVYFYILVQLVMVEPEDTLIIYISEDSSSAVEQLDSYPTVP